MLAVHLPAFRLERCGYSPLDPVVLIEFGRSADRVVACTPPAAKAGILPGMVLAEARALLPEVRVERREGEGEAGDLLGLRDAMLRFSPAVAAVLPDSLLIDIGPPEKALAEKAPTEMAAIARWIGGLGHTVRMAWAPEAWAALVLARSAGPEPTARHAASSALPAPVLRNAGQIAAALAPLPVGALGLDPDILESLADVGVRTIGQFACLPVAALAGRYGPEAARLHAIARGVGVLGAGPTGRGGRPLGASPLTTSPLAASPSNEPVWACDFDDPVEQIEALLFVVHGLCRDCEAALSLAGTAAARVQLRLRLAGISAPEEGTATLSAHAGASGGEHLVPVRLGQPVRGADRLFRQLRARLERVQSEWAQNAGRVGAPVEAVALELLESVPWRPPQAGLFERADAAEPLPELLARLQDAVGSESVFRAAVADAWRPEVAWSPVRPGEAAPCAMVPKKADAALVHEPDASAWSGEYHQGKVPLVVPLPPARARPSLVLGTPRPVRVAAGPSGRPRALLMDRDTLAITALVGPERLAGEWWRERSSFCRDYWCATLADGRRAWIYCESTGVQAAASAPAGSPASGSPASRSSTGRRWFVHGWLDGGGPEEPGAPGVRPDMVDAKRPATVLAFPGVRPPTAVLPVAPTTTLSASPRSRARAGVVPYAALCCRSNYSFSEGASFPEELLVRAQELGLSALALTDRDGSYGAVRAHRHAKTAAGVGRQAGASVQLIHGALVAVRADPSASGGRASSRRASLAVLVQNLEGWGSLCRLLSAERFLPGAGGTPTGLDAFSIGIPADPRAVTVLDPDPARDAASRHTGKGWPELPLDAVLADNAGLLLLARGDWSESALQTLQDAAGDRLYRAISRRLDPGETERIDHTLAAMERLGIACVASTDVLCHDPSRQPLQDALACIRLGLTLDQAGRRLQPNAERCLLSPEAMGVRFARWTGLLERTLEVAGRCNFSLKELTYSYPREVVPEGYGAQGWLRELVRRGLITRYGTLIPEKVARQVEYELGVIERLNFPAYFLTVHDLVRFARSRGILCQGRGSAANSAVCWALGITAVDPAHSSLLFERFISEERGEPPDIDVDFEHERREEVIQYCYEKYGRGRAAMVNEIISYRGRSSVRDVGKAVGLGLDQVDRLCGLLDSWGRLSEGDEVLVEAGLDPKDSRVQLAMSLSRQIQGFPRHTSIHVGGFVISDGPLVDRAPIEPATMPGRTVIQWDKDDVDELGFVKVDLLALGMLSAIRKCFDLVRAHHGVHLDLSTVPREDPAVYEMLGEADSIGVFQVESRAQQGMLPRLRPRCFYDLVIEVSVVRPGPIQGGMVHPYLRRRQGLEEVEYADPRLVPILERTLGVPIFQEQVMAMAVAVGGFSPGEADQLRRAMGAWRKRGGLAELTEKLMGGLLGNGLQPEYAERVCKQIQGFAEYGFPESHAASFAHLVYVSSWQRCFYPAAFTAALINSQPMGFYAPRTLVADIERHGVEVRPVDVRVSEWDCTLEPGVDGPAIRLGMRLVKGLGEVEARTLVRERERAPFASLSNLAVRTRLDRGSLRALARADALGGLMQAPAPDSVEAVPAPVRSDRRAAAFAVDGLWPGMFAGLARPSDSGALPLATPAEAMQADYAAVGLTCGTHPLALVRGRLDREGVIPFSRLHELAADTQVTIAGLVGVRQRPDTASGVIFLMLEDETGTTNVVVWPKLYQRQRKLIRTQRLLKIRGTLQRMDGAISIVAHRVWAFDIGADVPARSRDFH